jgi:hypothetical protein
MAAMRIMTRKTMGSVLTLALVVGGSGCIDDPTTLSEDGIPITEAEAEFLGVVAWRQSVEARLASDVEEPPGAPAAGPALAVIQESGQASVTRACEFGGTAQTSLTASLTYDDVADTGQIHVDLVQTHQECSVDRNGTRLTLNGWPRLEASIDAARLAGGAKTLTASLEGGVRVTRGEDTGICILDLSIEGAEQPDGSGTYSVSGSACGAAIDATTTTPATT